MVTHLHRRTQVVLVVDDEPDLVESLRFDLEHYGYQILTALDGRAAVETARREVPDLILLDLALPVLDGYGVLKELKSDPRCRHIPVLVISARSDPQGLAQALDWGDADSYYAKPLKMDVLIKLIRNILGEADGTSKNPLVG